MRFEAPHVINARTQVWAGSIAAGPDKHSLTATFEHSKRPAFQVQSPLLIQIDLQKGTLSQATCLLLLYSVS